MIHLDTNYLIGLVTIPSSVAMEIRRWTRSGEEFSASAIAWSEFLNGPVTMQETRDVSSILAGRVVSFGEYEARVASDLFNRTGRKRQKQIDCFIAATAICARVPLATRNTKDFQPFVPLGLRLA